MSSGFSDFLYLQVVNLLGKSFKCLFNDFLCAATKEIEIEIERERERDRERERARERERERDRQAKKDREMDIGQID